MSQLPLKVSCAHVSLPPSRSYSTGGEAVTRKYDPLLLRGYVRFAPIMCVPDASDTIRCVVWTACSEYRLNPKAGTYATLVNVIL